MTPTFLQELEAEAELVRSRAEKIVGVPPTGKLAVRCKPPTDPEAKARLSEVVAVYRLDEALSPDQEKQLLIDCCDEIVRRTETGEWESIEGDGPLRFDASDERWGDDVHTARECVAKLFHLDAGQPLALSGPADAIVDWLQGLDAMVAAAVGKQSPADEGS